MSGLAVSVFVNEYAARAAYVLATREPGALNAQYFADVFKCTYTALQLQVQSYATLDRD